MLTQIAGSGIRSVLLFDVLDPHPNGPHPQHCSCLKIFFAELGLRHFFNVASSDNAITYLGYFNSLLEQLSRVASSAFFLFC